MSNKIAMLPYGAKPGLGLARIRLDTLDWPLEPGVRHEGTVGDLGPEDHLLIPPNSQTLYLPHPGVRCKVTTWIVEPRAIHAKHFFWLRLFGHRFHRIFTYNADFIKRMPNARFTLSGWSWIKDPEAMKAVKTKMTSLIASRKKDLDGHQLRHRVAQWVQKTGADVDLLGRGYKEFGAKEEGLAPYRFSVVIENSSEQGYVSEKIMDCMICKTVPVYWGAPDISDHFDTRGIIICRDYDDIVRELGALSEDRYDALSEYVEINRQKAIDLAHLDRNIANKLLEEDAVS